MADNDRGKPELVDMGALSKLSHDLFSVAPLPATQAPPVTFGHEARDHMMRHRFSAPAEPVPDEGRIDLSALQAPPPPTEPAPPKGPAQSFPKLKHD